MTAEREPMAARLARIMGEVGRIEKKGKITSRGDGPTYKFARDADVLEAVTPKMAEAGIVMVPEHQELLSMTENMRGTQIIANIKTGWHVTDGNESIRFETFGQGQDSGDKALPKAQSNARKYGFFMLYHIVTGDDPDHFASDEQPERGSMGHRAAGAAASSQGATASAPAPAPAQYKRAELADLMAEKGISLKGLEDYSTLAGIPKGERATDEQMDKLIEAIRGHGTEQEMALPLDSGDKPDEPEAGLPTPPAIPPKPGTDEYKALESREKAAARAHWAKEEVTA